MLYNAHNLCVKKKRNIEKKRERVVISVPGVGAREGVMWEGNEIFLNYTFVMRVRTWSKGNREASTRTPAGCERAGRRVGKRLGGGVY